MKRLTSALIIVFAAVLLMSFLTKPLIISLAKKQLRNVFVASTVSIGRCDFKPLGLLKFLDIEIKKEPLYIFKFKEAGFQYSLFSILKGSILKFSLSDGSVVSDTGRKGVLELTKHIRLKPAKPALKVNSLEIRNLFCSLKSGECLLDAKVSLGLSLLSQTLDYFDLQVNSLEASGFQLRNALVRAGDIAEDGLLSIAQIKYGELKITNLKGKTRITGKSFLVDDLSASFLKGKIQGDAVIRLVPAGEYSLNLEFRDLDLETLVNDADLGEKVNLSGRLEGKIVLKGQGQVITTLSGDFLTLEPSGTLTIKDTSYLEGLARSSDQPLDILVESFKNYNYNKGVVKLGLNEGNLILDIALDGASGKRDLNITIHDFELKMEAR